MQFIVKLSQNRYTSHAASCDESDAEGVDAVLVLLKGRIVEEFEPLVDRKQVDIKIVLGFVEDAVRQALLTRQGSHNIHRIDSRPIHPAAEKMGADIFPDTRARFLEIQILDDEAVAERDAFVDNLFRRSADGSR